MKDSLCKTLVSSRAAARIRHSLLLFFGTLILVPMFIVPRYFSDV